MMNKIQRRLSNIVVGCFCHPIWLQRKGIRKATGSGDSRGVNQIEMPQPKENKRMSVLLRNLRSAKYVEHPAGWTENPENARQFGGTTDALFYCCQHQLHDMEIHAGEFRIPLTEIGWDSADKLAE